LVKATYRWVAANMMVLGVSNIGMAWSPNVWIAFVWAIPLGIGGVSVITAVNAITQQESPPDMRGRLLALTGVAFLGSTPIGGPITGFIAELVTVQWSLAYGGITSLASGVYMMMWMWKKGVERG
jgi:MFS family permease